MPSVTGRTHGGVVRDDETWKGWYGLVLRAVADPKHIPTVTIRGQRLRGGGRVEDMSAPEGELSKLGFQRDVPIGVVFKN